MVHELPPSLSVWVHEPIVLLDPETERLGVTPLIGLLLASRNIIETTEVEVPLATMLVVAESSELAAFATPAVNVKLAVLARFGSTRVTVLASALVEVNEQVATPEELVVPQARF